MRQLGDEYHVVGHPPLRDLALVELEELALRDLLAGFLHRHHDRPLVPLRMLDADPRGLGPRGRPYGDVFPVDRADPLAAGLDHVLRAVGYLHVTVGIDGSDVAGGEPARAVRVLPQRVAAFAPEIALD